MPEWKNQLHFGDNLDVLRKHIPHESVDLVYLDPPFNSNATYNVLFSESSGTASAAQITAFEDTWHWGPEAAGAYHEVVTEGPQDLARLLEALRAFLGQNDMMAYLVMMAVRLVELHRVLKPTGCIYLHCDPTASHYLKLILDAVFGPESFRNEIVWKRTHAHGSAKRFAPVHDIILFYTKSDRYTWTSPKGDYDPAYVKSHFTYSDANGRIYQPISLTGPGTRKGESGLPWRGFNPTEKGRHWALPGSILAKAGIEGSSVQEKLDALDSADLIYWPPKTGGVPRLKLYLDQMEGAALGSVWVDISPINSQAQERLGYPTQKPESLLERILRASSNEGDLVLDPFCGCGTAVAVAERLHRRWIGIDITHIAIALMRSRLHESFGKDLSPYVVHGDPKDLASAQALAQENRYQFQWWAAGLIEARPAQGQNKKGADSGIDGLIAFFDDASGKAKRVIVQVKSGHVQVGLIRDLAGVLEREKAPIGVFVTLEEPTKPMRDEALAAGFYTNPLFPGKKWPRIQILTIKEILAGKRPDYPSLGVATFKKAALQNTGVQLALAEA